jgi:hypothetical protein
MKPSTRRGDQWRSSVGQRAAASPRCGCGRRGEGHVVVLGEEADRGRGVGVGAGGVGEVEQLPAGLAAEGLQAGRRRSVTSRRRVRPDQVWTSMEPWPGRRRPGSAGPTRSIEGAGSSGRPSQVSVAAQVGRPFWPQTPRGGSWTTGPGGGRRSAARWRRRGPALAMRVRSWAVVRGRSSSRDRPAASTASKVDALEPAPEGAAGPEGSAPAPAAAARPGSGSRGR